MWGPEKRFVYVAPCHTSGLSPRSMIPSVMAPGQSVDLTPGGRVGERGSWKNRFKPFLKGALVTFLLLHSGGSWRVHHRVLSLL